ncbi:two-component system response regulator YesN [Paenibacillus mucilaginosus]|uniref:response regulator transcription factor n=1 Tax=Paenibacillus mucilaginosus TaxID=61624 RepID=UPI003D24BC34
MYNLLVVDDEQYAVAGIIRTIRAADLEIGGIFRAYGVQEAKEVLQETGIDLIICDIEMPGDNGLELLRWVNRSSPHTQTIFLTGHAEFSYAQAALQLGCADYLLKPVGHEKLREAVARELDKIRMRCESVDREAVAEKYRNLWESRKGLLVERFWYDLLKRREFPTSERLQEILSTYGLALERPGGILPILLNIEQWKRPLSASDEEIMKYALRNAAAELILGSWEGTVLQNPSGSNIVLVYDGSGAYADKEELAARCERYILACSEYFYCRLSCYIGTPAPIRDLPDAHARLTGSVRSQAARPPAVAFVEALVPQPPTVLVPLSWYTELSVLFESGQCEEVMRALEEQFSAFEAQPLTPESLGAFYHAFLQMIYHTLHKNGLSVHDVYAAPVLHDMLAATRTLGDLRAWAVRVVTEGMSGLQAAKKIEGPVVEKVRRFIDDHLAEELTREELAAYVHFHPSYLSRLFKRTTGFSLTGYILERRMDKAKRLLAESTLRVSDIAQTVGYSNFSHFTKLFKKATGQTPQDYRKTRRDEARL